jgi:hypothetical protein
VNNLILIDTDILIDAGRNDSEAVQYLEQARAKELLSISVVTQYEIFPRLFPIILTYNRYTVRHFIGLGS